MDDYYLNACTCVKDTFKQNFTKKEEEYDLILGVNGHHAISAYERSLNANGTFIHVGGSGTQLFQTITLGPWFSIVGRKKMSSLLQRQNQKDLIFMKELIEAKKVKPIIDKVFKLSEMKEAFKYFEQGHAQGKIVITI